MAGLAGASSSLVEVIYGNSDSFRGLNIPKSEDMRPVSVPVAADVGITGEGFMESVPAVEGMASSTSLPNNASKGEEDEGGDASGRRGEMTFKSEDNVVVCGDGCDDGDAEIGRGLADGARLTTAELGRSFPDNMSSLWLFSDGYSAVTKSDDKVLVGRGVLNSRRFSAADSFPDR